MICSRTKRRSSSKSEDTSPDPKVEERQSRAGRNLPAAIAVGVGLVLMILVTLFVVPKDAFVAVVVIALGIGLWELTHAFAKADIHIPFVPVLTGGTIMLVSAFYGGMETAAVAMALTVIATLVWRLSEGVNGFVRDSSAGMFVLSYLFLVGVFVLLMLAEADGPWRVVAFIVATTFASDIGGYASGVLFGRHPMARPSAQEVVVGLRPARSSLASPLAFSPSPTPSRVTGGRGRARHRRCRLCDAR